MRLSKEKETAVSNEKRLHNPTAYSSSRTSEWKKRKDKERKKK